MVGLPELKGGATRPTESATATRSMVEKPKKCPGKVSDAPHKNESRFCKIFRAHLLYINNRLLSLTVESRLDSVHYSHCQKGETKVLHCRSNSTVKVRRVLY